MLDRGIRREWRTVRVPLAAFTALADLSSVETLSLIVENRLESGSGTILVEDVHFEKRPGTLTAAAFTDRTGRSAWGGEFWTFSTRAAHLRHRADDHGCLVVFDGVRASREEVSWCGLGMDLEGLDASGFGSLAFRIKRVHGVEKPNLYLEDGSGRRYVDVEAYLKEGESWQTVRIPLQDFADQGLDLRDLRKLSFVFEWENMSGAICLNDLRFEASRDREAMPGEDS